MLFLQYSLAALVSYLIQYWDVSIIAAARKRMIGAKLVVLSLLHNAMQSSCKHLAHLQHMAERQK